MGILRTLRTVRHLRPIQVTNRITRRLRPGLPEVAIQAPALVPGARPSAPARVEQRFDGSAFTFLNQRLEHSGQDRWSPRQPRLWLYQLHYFRYIHALPSHVALEMMLDWIACNPPGTGAGWDPYPTSLRTREWIEWIAAHPDLGAAHRAQLLHSVALQIGALHANLEWHLLGNHLLENAISLCWAGASLMSPRSERWLARGRRLLESLISEQILADGSHDERSPMYQASIAETLLRLAEVAPRSSGTHGTELSAIARNAGQRLASSLSSLVHPDGEIALLNDAALGEAPTLEQLCRRFELPGPGPRTGTWKLPDAGYYGWRPRPGTALIFDAGPLAPDHNMAHGHADVAAFELSHGGRRLVTDTGVMTYDPGDVRSYDRSAAAHSTLTLDGSDQAELWSAFRCGARPTIEAAAAEQDSLTGAYRVRNGGLSYRHVRTIEPRGESLCFRDEIHASGHHEATLRLHLAPDTVVEGTSSPLRLLRDAGAVAEVDAPGFTWTIDETPYHPELGREHRRPCLRATVPLDDRITLDWRLRLLRG